MTRGQLAILPIQDGRRSERRIVNLAARLRDPGARTADVEVMNISTDGFMARGMPALEVGAQVWLKVSGLEPQSCRVIWNEGEEAGFEFLNPLHPGTVEMLAAANRPPAQRRRFGPIEG